ncbi:serine hydrolase domain-containing protein [Stratiformator vulcanicus]|uniref:Penicillin-binding protein 4 n=1 Tax=Stratiformator vulcanicus TaxID=2527980 RepID=A0A517QZF1_9PLAN|nr:serine hydrolase domain-containing protein [Stratiformator vulcanicus]QDT37011.1 Penicillin-binding protein 4* [Stratiformator vulcanicus]
MTPAAALDAMLTDDPAEAGLDPRRWRRVMSLAEKMCETGEVPAISIAVGSSDSILRPINFGWRTVDRAEPIGHNPRYLVASITKPIVAMGLLMLVERGELTLSDRVIDHVPDFKAGGRRSIRIRNLLTHTSGLPDMPDDNAELRQNNAGLDHFLERACTVPLLFEPGRDVTYSSLGFVVLGEIIERTTGLSCGEFLKREFFSQLGMNETALGMVGMTYETESATERIAEIRLPEMLDYGSGHWNSPYWRNLGAPWGGLISSAEDLARFAVIMLRPGPVGGTNFFEQTSLFATSNQLAEMPYVPEHERRCRPWGYGWRMNWPANGSYFGDFLAANAFGHWGATGTSLWIDPPLNLFAVILTTEPAGSQGRHLARLSNAIQTAAKG